MQLTQKEENLLSTYQSWLNKNNLSGNCNAYFIEKNSMLVFQVWELEKLISETIWLKSDNEKWQFYIKTLDEKFNKSFLLEEILKIEKDFVLKTFKENGMATLFRTIFFDLNEIIHRNEKIYLAIILEFKPNKSKIIFDLSKIIDEIILENTFKSIFWKIGNKTKKDNNIIKKYDNFIHKKIINLLNLENNDEIEKNITKLKKYIKDNKKNK